MTELSFDDNRRMSQELHAALFVYGLVPPAAEVEAFSEGWKCGFAYQESDLLDHEGAARYAYRLGYTAGRKATPVNKTPDAIIRHLLDQYEPQKTQNRKLEQLLHAAIRMDREAHRHG